MKIFILTLLAVATYVWPFETTIFVWLPWYVIASSNYEVRRYKEIQALYDKKPKPQATHPESSSLIPTNSGEETLPVKRGDMMKAAKKIVLAFGDFHAEREVNCCPIHDAGELPYPKAVIGQAFHLIVEYYEQKKAQSPELADVELEEKLNTIKSCWAILSTYQEIDQADKPILELLSRTGERAETEQERREILRVLTKYEAPYACD